MIGGVGASALVVVTGSTISPTSAGGTADGCGSPALVDSAGPDGSVDVAAAADAAGAAGVVGVAVTPATASSTAGGTEGARTEVDRDREGSRPGDGFPDPLVAACLAAFSRLNLPPFDAEVDEADGGALGGRDRCTGKPVV